MNTMNTLTVENKPKELTRAEAADILTRYYRHLREHNMDRLCWDVVNQAAIALGGEGDSTLNHEEYMRRYEADGVTFEDVLEDEIHWTERVPEIDDRLPEAMKIAKAAMERRTTG